MVIHRWPVESSQKGPVTQERFTLQWRHNGRDGIANHQPHDCLLYRLFRQRSKKIWKPRVSGLCAGNSLVTCEFPTQMARNAEKHFHLMTSSCTYICYVGGWHIRTVIWSACEARWINDPYRWWPAKSGMKITGVSAEIVRHKSTYIISFLTRHDESINNDNKDDIYNSSPCLIRWVVVLLMTSRSFADDVTMTRQFWHDHVNSDI